MSRYIIKRLLQMIPILIIVGYPDLYLDVFCSRRSGTDHPGR